MSGRLEAMTAESAAKTVSKRKNAPKEDEEDGDDSGSDGGSDVVRRVHSFCLHIYFDGEMLRYRWTVG
jgi:hypothetical protein